MGFVLFKFRAGSVRIIPFLYAVNLRVQVKHRAEYTNAILALRFSLYLKKIW